MFRGKKSKVRLTGMVASATGEKLPMFVIWKSRTPCCFKIWSIYPVNTNHKRRVGWIVRSLKSGSVNSTESFVQIIEKLLLSLTNVQPIHQSQTWPTSKLYFCPQIRRPFFNRLTKVLSAAWKRITEEGLYVCYTESWRKKILVQRFHFAIIEDTEWFLGGGHQRNHHQLFQEGRNHACCSTGGHCWFRKSV